MTSYKLLSLGLTSALLVSSPTMALEWRLAIGGHDFIVDQANSHTLGLNAALSFQHQFENQIAFSGNLAILYDHDKDKLDPDHIPVWFMSSYQLNQTLLEWDKNIEFGWQISLDGRQNTVSGIEKQLRLFSGLTMSYNNTLLSGTVDISAGYFMLEFDDDVPKTLGYVRGEFDRDTGALSTGFNGRLKLNDKWAISASARTWHDGDTWLENRYTAGLILTGNSWKPDSQLKIEGIFHQYNLTPYETESANYRPILPWNRDLVMNLSFNFPISF